MSSDAPPQSRYIPPSRRRDKPILSCNLCRRRKLKCDRQQPCKACIDRGLSLSCAYSRHNPSQTASENKPSSNVHDRIDQLEKLVTTLMNEKRKSIQGSPGLVLSNSPPAVVDDTDGELPGTPDRVKLEGNETSYTNSGHWTSILDGIAELKDTLDEIPTDPQPRDPMDEITGPELFFGRHNHATREEILAGLPPKQEADQLVVEYYAFMDMAPTLIHRPTFLRDYENFWRNPDEAPLMWLCVMFSIFAVATRLQTNFDEFQDANPDPGKTKMASVRVALYREKAAQCLILGDYSKCPPWTLEAFLSYFVIEYLRSTDSQFASWLLIGMIIRIALRMGYHREPSRFPNISPFQAEMRRRLWTMIVQLDLMSAMQVGLPRMIQDYMSDVMEPRNLTDADLMEDMSELPPSRPDSDSTMMLYAVIRNRCLRILARIVDLTNTGRVIPYREILALDTALIEHYNEVPESLKGTEPICFNAGSDVSLRRVYLGITYLKALIMLHRPYMLLGRTDERYQYSRRRCIDAALRIVDIQVLISKETRAANPNLSARWRLWTSSWRQSSAVNSDFLLATTVLLLDLDRDLAFPLSPSPEDVSRVRFKSGQPTRAEVVEALRSLHSCWTETSIRSREAIKVVTALEIVLAKVDANDAHPQAPVTDDSLSDPLALFAPQVPDIAMNGGRSPGFIDFGNPNLSLPFPMADIPMDFGGSFDWARFMAPEYPVPSPESHFPNLYNGNSNF